MIVGVAAGIDIGSYAELLIGAEPEGEGIAFGAAGEVTARRCC